jgi:hypothetical protein
MDSGLRRNDVGDLGTDQARLITPQYSDVIPAKAGIQFFSCAEVAV